MPSCLSTAALSVAVALGLLVTLMLLSTYLSYDRRHRRTMQASTCGVVESARGYLARARAAEKSHDATAQLLLASRAHALLGEATRQLADHGMPQTLCSGGDTGPSAAATSMLDESRVLMVRASEAM